MITLFDWFALVLILALTYAGGFLPLFKPDTARSVRGFPAGQAFAAGVFLALALTLMLPSSFHLFHVAFPGMGYPVASVVAILCFLFLLSIEHITCHMHEKRGLPHDALMPPIIPIIMTCMIAVPSFFLGAALGVSPQPAATVILIAIIAHKSSAGFALALKMARSTMSRPAVFLLFTFFACSTPVGILVGGWVHSVLGMHAMTVVKAFILAMASGVFLYMSTLHELKNTPLIEDCRTRKGFLLLICGFVLTALVRWLIGEAHSL